MTAEMQINSQYCDLQFISPGQLPISLLLGLSEVYKRKEVGVRIKMLREKIQGQEEMKPDTAS